MILYILKLLPKLCAKLLTAILLAPFELIKLLNLLLMCGAVGVMGGGVVYVACLWLTVAKPEYVAVPWGVGIALFFVAERLYAVYVRGEPLE